LKKYEIVKNKREFDYIIKNCKFIKNKYYVIYYKENGLNISRFGIAVGKKVGKAYIRNKVKRQIRMIITNNKNIFKKGYDYIIIVKGSVLLIKYDKMTDELINLMK